MKANRSIRKDRAEVGVGTLIVFIAMVLVAAVAAAVLINTTGTLQQRAQATGAEATSDVSSNLKVLNVYGSRAGTAASDDIDNLTIAVQLSAGAVAMDLEQLVIRFSDGTNAPTNYVFEDYDGLTLSDNGHFQANWVRGEANGTEANAVMKAGDLVELTFTLANEIAERSAVSVTLIPETGASVMSDFRTPATYGTETRLTLR